MEIKNKLDNYAKLNPKKAHHLGLNRGQSYSPFIELLIQAFCDVKESLEQKISNDVDHIEISLYQNLFSEFFCELPVKTVFILNEGVVQELPHHFLKKGLVLSTNDDSDVEIKFTLARDESFIPYAVRETTIKDGQLCTHLSAVSHHRHKMNKLTFYIHHRLEAQYKLLEKLFFTKKMPCVLVDGRVYKAKKIQLAYEDLLKNENPSALISDYFNFRQRYFFISIALEDEIFDADNIQVNFELGCDEVLQDYADVFKVNALIAQNCFEKYLEPVLVNKPQIIPILSCHYYGEGYEIVNIIDVKNDGNAGYHISPNNNNWHLHIESIDLPTTFTVKAAVCNNQHLLQTLPNSSHYIAENSSISFSMLTCPGTRINKTKMLQSIKRSGLKTINKIRDRDSLVSLLLCFATIEQDNMEVQSITAFNASTGMMVKDGVIKQRFHIKIYMDDSCFQSLGHLQLFSYVIHLFFKSSLSLDYVVTTEVFSSDGKNITEFC